MSSSSRSTEIGSLFCHNSSLRGVSKISKSNSLFLRSLWFVFVLMMCVLLVYSTVMVVSNYRDYDVAIQTTMLLNNLSEFPTLTVCSHYPFSKRAAELWRNGRARTPAQFNTMLRNITRDTLLQGRLRLAQKLTFYDKIRVYYQNLDLDQTVELSHSVKEFLLHCMIIRGSYTLVGKDEDCGLQFQLVSNPSYFNCYSIKPKAQQLTQRVAAIYLIVDLGVPPDMREWQEAFIMDIFDQAFGLRLMLHEDGLFPNMEKGGIHIEPGKMMEIAFDTVLWKEANDSPNDRCHEGHEPKIYDLGRNYSYSYQACIDLQLNRKVIDKCGCMMARLPRPAKAPSHKTPYCANIDPNNTRAFFKRLHCLEKLDVRSIRQEADGSVCKKRCQRFEYQQQSSMTRWRATDLQLHWMIDQAQSWAQLLKANATKDAKKKRQTTQKIMNYLNSTNLRQAPKDRKIRMPSYYNQYAYIIIRRKSFDTTQKMEKLTVTFEALMSRIGGLCSLYLGLTMAFFVEIIEFFYLLCEHYRGPQSQHSEMQKLKS